MKYKTLNHPSISLATHSKPKTKISQFIGVRNALTDILGVHMYICRAQLYASYITYGVMKGFLIKHFF
jgi:hypothetical protein